MNDILFKRLAEYYGMKYKKTGEKFQIFDEESILHIDPVKNECYVQEHINIDGPIDEFDVITSINSYAIFGENKPNDEIVLILDTSSLPVNKVVSISKINGFKMSWLPRSLAESNIGIRHVIPYCCVMNTAGQILVYDREGSEKRLHGQKSIGYGGHINPIDMEDVEITTDDIIVKCMERELEEELGIQIDRTLIKFIYFYQSDKTEVDKVHSCISAIVTLLEPVDIALAGQNGTWTEVMDINIKDLENWSKILYREIRKDLLAPEEE